MSRIIYGEGLRGIYRLWGGADESLELYMGRGLWVSIVVQGEGLTGVFRVATIIIFG